MLTFDSAKPGIDYPDRPAAYGIAFDEQGRVATTKEPHGFFLPGGGIDPGEDPIPALKREFLEELGWTVTVGEFIGEAACYHYSLTYQQHFKNLASFYLITGWEKTGEPTELGHVLVWLSPDEVKKQYFHPHQVWAVQQAVNHAE